MKRYIFLVLFLVLFGGILSAQISAPTASSSFSTNYTPGFLGAGGQNDLVYVFCSDQDNDDVGQLTVVGSGCTVVWYYYDGYTYSELGQMNNVATGLTSGLYMAQVNCAGTINCYRAWVWVNQTFVSINTIEPGCETFTLTGQASALDSQFEINDPPGLNFEIDEDTYIQVCFWANHTYVSDLGFYLKAPGESTTEPNHNGVVALLPAASDWGAAGQFQSNTTIPWSVTGCDPTQENVDCNPGNHVEEFCFSTNYWLAGPVLSSANPAQVPCVCDMPTPLTGVWAPAESWSRIYGYMAGDPGWAVQIYDCQQIDYGTLTMARLVFSANANCGQTTFIYDSGEISSTINDNSCAANNASIYIVPPSEPAGEYVVTSSITDYSWSCTGSGFTGDQLSHQIVHGTGDFPVSTSDFVLTVTETISAPGSPQCISVASETFYTLPADATITSVAPVCSNGNPFQLVAADGGGTWTTNAPVGSIVNNTFYPGIAGAGDWTVTYNITGPCPDQDQEIITVYETIEIQDFSDVVCDAFGENFTVSFNVVNNLGNSASFIVDYGSGSSTLEGIFNHSFPNLTHYSITVTDTHGCNEFILNGYRDCGCTTYAGTLSSTAPIQLCVGDCTASLLHNGNDDLDGNDMLEFVIHNGATPPVIYAYNLTKPEFCFNNISGGQTGTVYYISAIAGNVVGGHVQLNDPCYSQSISTPVIWYANPTAHITTTTTSVCGLTVELLANVPGPGQIGTWTATGPFIPLGGQTVNDNHISVIKQLPYGSLVFTWTVVNSICSSSDDITISFNEQPNAYAGPDFQICGNEAQLAASLSLPFSNGYWTGNGSFTVSSNPETMVSSSGTQVFSWREENGPCSDIDYVTVTFVQTPQPAVSPNVDTVCGVKYNLNVYNVTGTGSWAAYSDGVLYAPAPEYIGGVTNPNAQVIVSYGGEVLSVAIDFVWTESLSSESVVCTNTATKRVVFSRKPIASVGASDIAEICGNCIELQANITGQEWASGFWIPKGIILESADDLTSPNATICIDPIANFGDTARIEVEFLWVMKNAGCVSMDTMWVTFYQQPNANAGIDKAVCGNENDMNAVWNLPPNSGYTPTGIWSVGTHPTGESATWGNTAARNSHVTVSEVGIWEFIFRENNSFLTSCYDTDTVQIEFVEVPVISAGPDKDVCGNCTAMDGISGGFGGLWLPISGAEFVDFTDPNTNVCIPTYVPTTFTWLESNSATTQVKSCTATDDVVITFWRVPSANIMTDEADSTVCGLRFDNLRAESSGTGITGYWYNINPSTVYGDAFSNNTWAKVPTYGYHNFYWIEQTGPALTPGFCNDTAGPLRIKFIKIPTANAGGDTLFCGYTGKLNAMPSVGTGVWSTPSGQNITFADQNNAKTPVTSNIINTGHPTYPNFKLIWTENNSSCTDNDTVLVIFARVPTSEMDIIPPKCFGEPATIAASEDSLQQYSWSFNTGVVDSLTINALGGRWENFVYWNSTDTAHRVSLIATNSWGCQSPIRVDTVYEPIIPKFDIEIIMDTCALGKGGFVFHDTLGTSAFMWTDPNFGPAPGTTVDTVYNLPMGEYGIHTSYQTPNMENYAYYNQIFGTANCVDTFYYEVETIGMIDADMSVSGNILLTELVAPDAKVTFMNTSDYDNVSKRCEWHFGDGSTAKTCDELVEHIYTKAGCFEPFLVVMNRNLPECRDTARLETCIFVDDASKLEVPNIFSPNGDGINDFFQVKARTLKSFNGTITNRWGRTVFEWTDWETYESGWDGKIGGGSKASPGVYFYIITAEGLDGEPHNFKGALHLMSE